MAEELWAPDRNPASYNSMYSVSTRRITAPARGEPAPIYLLSKIQLQALSLPKCYCLLLWCILNLFYPFQKKDESTHFYPVRNMNSHLNWRVTERRVTVLISTVRRGYWNVEELKTLPARANGELLCSASFCLSLFIEKKNGRWCRRLVVLQDLFWLKFMAGTKMLVWCSSLLKPGTFDLHMQSA